MNYGRLRQRMFSLTLVLALSAALVGNSVTTPVVYAADSVKINTLATNLGGHSYNQEGNASNALDNGSYALGLTSVFDVDAVVNQMGYGSVDLDWHTYKDEQGRDIYYDKNYVVETSTNGSDWSKLSLDYRNIDNVNILQIYGQGYGKTSGCFDEMNYWLHTVIPVIDEQGNFVFKDANGRLVYKKGNYTDLLNVTVGSIKNYDLNAWNNFLKKAIPEDISKLTPMFTTVGTGSKIVNTYDVVRDYVNKHTFSSGSVTIKGDAFDSANRTGYFRSSYASSKDFQQLITVDAIDIQSFSVNPWFYLRSHTGGKHVLAYRTDGSSYRCYWSDNTITTSASVPSGDYLKYQTKTYSPSRVKSGFGSTGSGETITASLNNGVVWYVNAIDGWQYDVTLSGLQDGGIGSAWSLDASSAVQCAISSGRGHYMGHDDGRTPASQPYFQYILLLCGGYQDGPAERVYSQKIYQTGLLTTYPFYLGSVGTALSMQWGHTWDWHLMSDVKEWSYLTDSWARPYIFTRNNCGMMNIGDFGCNQEWYNTTVMSEVLMVGNMGFYCNQLAYSRFSNTDANATDKAAPSTPQISFTSDGWVAKSVDQGSTYYYRVQSYDKDHGTLMNELRSTINGTTGQQDLSNTVKVDVKTGVRKYVYVLDNNPNTVISVKTSLTKDLAVSDKDSYILNVDIPAGCQVATATDLTSQDSLYKYVDTMASGNITGNNQRYIHVCAIDGAGNPSATATAELTREYKVVHELEQLDGTYKIDKTETIRGLIGQTLSPEVRHYDGWDSPSKQVVTVDWTSDGTITYRYKLHYYNITYDLQGGEWYAEQSDGSWKQTTPVTKYTVLTPDIQILQPDKVGYDFVGWTGTDVTKETLNVVIPKGSLGDRAYTAHWQAQAYDVDVPVSLLFSIGYDGLTSGRFDQDGDGTLEQFGYITNESKFPVQVTDVKYVNNGLFTNTYDMDADVSVSNIMNWRLDAQNGDEWTEYAVELEKGKNVSKNGIFWMAQNGSARSQQIKFDATNAWARHDKTDIKTPTEIGHVVWTFGIGERWVPERSIKAAK